MTRNPRPIPPAPTLEEILAAGRGQRVGVVDFGPPEPPPSDESGKADEPAADDEPSATPMDDEAVADDPAEDDPRTDHDEIVAAIQALTAPKKEVSS